MIKVKVEKLNPAAQIPKFATEGSAAADLYSVDDEIISAYSTKLIHTGIRVELPEGYEMQIRPRSGLALKNGLTVLNSPGTIDSDFRGEIGVIIHNSSNAPYLIRVGDRIAQAKISEVPKVEYVEVEKISMEVDRGGGFGSTGN